MKKFIARASTATGLLLTSAITHAHPGHDHSHWASSGIHSLTLLTVGLGIALSVYCFAKARNAQRQHVTQQEEK